MKEMLYNNELAHNHVPCDRLLQKAYLHANCGEETNGTDSHLKAKAPTSQFMDEEHYNTLSLQQISFMKNYGQETPTFFYVLWEYILFRHTYLQKNRLRANIFRKVTKF